MAIFVQYDTTTLSPTPIVNYSHQPVEFGYVYGYNTEITLDGLYSGITTTGTAISYITGVFANQFRALTVTDDHSNTLYSWSGITIDSITLENSPFFSGSFVRYSIKLRSFDVPSGVIDPSNEYSFNQGEDGTVTATHKVSARGVRNAAGAFDNAMKFVQQFSGKDPYSNCATAFVPGGSGILMSLTENINRADGTYIITEVYKYNTGVFNTPYTKFTTLDMSDALDAEYRSIDYSLKIQGSPVNNNVASILNNNLGYNLLSDIQTEFGFNTTNWIKNSYAAILDSGSAVIDIKVNYVSGANSSGYLDYNVTCEKDYLAGTENWKIDGDFKTFGPLEFRKNQVQLFKSASGTNDWRNFLNGLITNSAIYAGLHDASIMFSQNMKVDVTENQQLATLKLGSALIDGYEPLDVAELKYTWEVSPSKWIYELLPSATIEGAYVVQNLQTKTQTRQKISLSSKSQNVTYANGFIQSYLTSFVGQYVSTGNAPNVTAFLIEENSMTGTYDASANQTWLGADIGLSNAPLSLQSIGSNNDFAQIRPSGYNFGY